MANFFACLTLRTDGERLDLILRHVSMAGLGSGEEQQHQDSAVLCLTQLTNYQSLSGRRQYPLTSWWSGDIIGQSLLTQLGVIIPMT